MQLTHTPARTFVGISMSMSLIDNRTVELWRQFMPRRHVVGGRVGEEMYSLQVYPEGYYERFNPATVFEKWALVEVAPGTEAPEGMTLFQLPEGDYATFIHKGDVAAFVARLQYVLQEWIPASGLILDARPHFEVLGEKYRNGDPESEEEVWVPVRRL
ncbi:MAG TPA: GyrI-like domain-containing protein [Saprospiraceae bacterium]|nr:GyrI-like domain-containing protein [Saprospiraceae bacterium]